MRVLLLSVLLCASLPVFTINNPIQNNSEGRSQFHSFFFYSIHSNKNAEAETQRWKRYLSQWRKVRFFSGPGSALQALLDCFCFTAFINWVAFLVAFYSKLLVENIWTFLFFKYFSWYFLPYDVACIRCKPLNLIYIYFLRILKTDLENVLVSYCDITDLSQFSLLGLNFSV